MSNNAKNGKKATKLKRPALRVAGQGLSEYIQEQEGEAEARVLAYATAVLVMIVNEWWGYIWDSPRRPWVITTAGLLIIAWEIRRFIKLFRRLRPYRQGLDGERAVGHTLEMLTRDGYRVFHDVKVSRDAKYNIDHVLVGRAGIFVIETKSPSKSDGGLSQITYDGEHMLINGIPMDPNPVVQASANARDIKRLLSEAIGRELAVPPQPVVLIPEWWVNEAAGRPLVWVYNAERFCGVVRGKPDVLKPADVALYADRLTIHMRNLEQSA